MSKKSEPLNEQIIAEDSKRFFKSIIENTRKLEALEKIKKVGE